MKGRGVPWEQRFRVCQTTGCWLWLGVLYRGYGRLSSRGAHVVSYERYVGPVPDGCELDHRATCPKHCINPEHLEPVSHVENVRRGRRVLRGIWKNAGNRRRWFAPVIGAPVLKKVVCKNGHNMIGGNVYRRPDGKGHGCRICRRAAVRRRDQRLDSITEKMFK